MGSLIELLTAYIATFYHLVHVLLFNLRVLYTQMKYKLGKLSELVWCIQERTISPKQNVINNEIARFGECLPCTSAGVYA